MAIANPGQNSLKISGIDALSKNLKDLGATEGCKRLEFVHSQYKQLTPYTAHLLLNPSAVQEEIEEAQVNLWWIHIIHYFRNFFSLAPLIVTWIALFDAVTGYQQDLIKNPVDNTIPFLQLWQNGFNGFSKFTFTEAAGIDVGLLISYLVCIIVIHMIEQVAHVRAVKFVDGESWSKPVNELMNEIDKASKPFIADKSDIENVVGSVNRIVEEATKSLKTAADSAAEGVKQAANRMTDANKQVMENTRQSIKSFIDDAQLTLNHVITTSEQAVTQVVTSSQQTLTQVVTSSEEVIRQVVASSQQTLTQITTSSEQAVTRVVTASENAVTHSLGLSKQAIVESNKRVETLFEVQVKPLIEAFQRDLTALQGELRNYQGRLDDLTKATKTLADSGLELAKTSKVLEENAERYISIGQDIKTQVAALSNIQQDVLSQIGSISGNISTAAGNMSDARANMVSAIHEVKTLAWQLDHEMQRTINIMSTNIEGVSESLEKVTLPLEEASQRLYMASNLLASIRLFPFIRRRSIKQQGQVS